jgi:hypothetical protein
MNKIILACIISILFVSTIFAITYEGLTDYLKENTDMSSSRIVEILDGIYEQLDYIYDKYNVMIAPEMRG